MMVWNGRLGNSDKGEMLVTLHWYLAVYLKTLVISILCTIFVCK